MSWSFATWTRSLDGTNTTNRPFAEIAARTLSCCPCSPCRPTEARTVLPVVRSCGRAVVHEHVGGVVGVPRDEIARERVERHEVAGCDQAAVAIAVRRRAV